MWTYINAIAGKIASRHTMAFLISSDGDDRMYCFHVYCDIIHCMGPATYIKARIDPVIFHVRYIQVMSYIMILHAYKYLSMMKNLFILTNITSDMSPVCRGSNLDSGIYRQFQ